MINFVRTLVILFSFVALGGNDANADVVFLDMNAAAQEIEAARRAATSLGERFVVISGRGLNTETILARMQSNRDVQSASALRLVISGHRTRDRIHGENGVVQLSDLSAGLERAGLRAKVSTVFYAGCYQLSRGASPGNQQLWPEALVIGGFEEKGWLREVPVGHRIIYSFISAARRIEQTRSAEEAAVIVRRLDGWTARNACMVRGIWLNSERIKSIPEIIAECAGARVGPHEEYVRCLYNFRPECGDVPEDGSRGRIRENYVHQVETEGCDDLWPPGTRIGQNGTIALAFDHNVRRHLERNFSEELPALDRVLTQFGVPSNTLLSGFSRLPRHEIMRRIQDAEAYLKGRCSRSEAPMFCGDREFPEYNWALSRLDAIRRVYINPSICMPAQWIDPSAGAAHVQDTCGGRSSGAADRRRAEIIASEEVASKYISNWIPTVEDQVRPYIESMKSAYPPGGSPDTARLRQLNQDYERAVQIMVNSIPVVENGINVELQRLRQTDPQAAAEFSQNARQQIARRWAAILRARYGAPPLPTTN